MKKLLFTLGILLVFPLSVLAFSDVSDSDRFYKAVQLVEEQNIVSGYPDGSFRPDSNINRAEMLKIITESKFSEMDIDRCIRDNTTLESSYVFFTDVPKNQWYAPYVCIAKINGIVKGYPDNTFRPGNDVTFVEGLKMTAVAYGVDFEEGEIWYKDVVDKTAERNLIPLTIGSFTQTITRGEMADMVARFYEESKEKLNEYLEEEQYFYVGFGSLEEERKVDDDYQAYMKLPEETKEEIREETEETGPMAMLSKEHFVVDDSPEAAEMSNEITWQTVDLGTDETLNAVFFYDSDNGWIAGDDATLFKTTDGGSHWTQIDTHKNDGGFQDVYFRSPQTGFMIGAREFVYKSTDGGETWDGIAATAYDALSFDFKSLNFFSSAIYAIGTHGFAFTSTDGGNSWDSMNLSTTESLYDSDFVVAPLGYAVGMNGRVIKTSDGGDHWDILDSGIFNNLYGVDFLSSTKGFAVGASGIILRTLNGGTTWTEIESGTTSALYDIYFVNDNAGWIVGNDAILKTVDGGSTWRMIENQVDGILKSVYFINNGTGWAVGYDGLVIKTTTGDMLR